MNINFKKLFDWEIKFVTEPYRFVDFETGAKGLKVRVLYVHHGCKDKCFDTKNQQSWACYSSPEAAARAYYRCMMEKHLRQQEKKKQNIYGR